MSHRVSNAISGLFTIAYLSRCANCLPVTLKSQQISSLTSFNQYLHVMVSPEINEARVILNPVTLWPFWLQARARNVGLLFEGHRNHREAQQGPSSNNCSLLRGEVFPPLTQHNTVLVPQPTKSLSARFEGKSRLGSTG